MRVKRCAVFALLAGCAVGGHADPFAPAAPQVAAPPAADYRVVGAAVLGERAVAAVRVPNGRFRIVRPGERLGAATVVTITLDAVHLRTASGVLRLAVE